MDAEAWLALLAFAPIPAAAAWIAAQIRHLRVNRQVKAIAAAILGGGALVATMVRQGDIYEARTHLAPGDNAYMLALMMLEAGSAVAVAFSIAYRARRDVSRRDTKR